MRLPEVDQHGDVAVAEPLELAHHDLSAPRGQVTGTKTLQAGSLAVTGLAPLGELDGYAARLKSMTGGQGAWSMALSHYEQAPPPLQQQLAAEYAKQRKHEEE